MVSLRAFSRLAVITAFSATFAACGGGQSGTFSNNSLPPVTSVTPLPSVSPAVVISKGPNNAITLTGTITTVESASAFVIQGGSGVGYLRIYTTSTTTFSGKKPYVGESVEIVGTGSVSTSVTASSVTQMGTTSTSGNLLSATAPVVALGTGRFEIHGGEGVGYLWVYTTSSTTYVGAKPYVGENVTVKGTGSFATSLTAVSVTQVTSTTSTSGTLLTATAPVVALGTGRFEIHGGEGVGYVWVYTTSTTTYTGAKPYVGETVTVKGTGSFAKSITAVSVTQVTSTTASPTPAPTGSTTGSTTTTTTTSSPSTTSFMPSTWGKISAFQVFDETYNGYITQAAASANGWRYSTVWGSRWNIGTSWNNSNSALQTSYYNALETDPSYTGWGAIGHDLTWWKANHPDWVLYACTSSNTPTTYPAYVPGLTTAIPLDIHNPAVVQYQIRTMAKYAHEIGYHALAIDEATFWQADEGAGSGSFGCGIYQNGSFVRRYNGVNDPNWAADVVAWVKIAHSILTTDPTISTYHLKLIVNHPGGPLTSNETQLLANVDAVLNETGYSSYGRYQTSNTGLFVNTTNWAAYAQQHGTAVLMNDNWGSLSVTKPLLDYSVATYLMGNQQAESLFVSPSTGYGVEQWHSQYQTAIGAPCGAYYGGPSYDSSSPSIYYRRFANALVVVNGGSGSTSEVAHLPSGHTYTDLFGRAVSNPLTIPSNNGYVLLTSNGCQ